VSQKAEIYSGLCFFLAVFPLLSYQIFSRFTWCTTRRALHVAKVITAERLDLLP